jgi:ABC-type transporter Mla subunit MlaD
VSLLAQDPRLAQRVGAITILVAVAVIAGFVFLLDRVELGSPVRIRVLFRQTGGLHEHAALVVGGQPVGYIEAITPVPHAAGGPLAGGVGVAVLVAVEGDSAWKVPASAEIFVSSRGALADRYLEVAPPAGPPGAAIHDGQELRGIDPPSLDNALQRMWTNMLTFKLFVETVRPELAALRTQVDRLRAQIAELASDPQAAGRATLGDETRALIAEARTTYDTALGGAPGLGQLGAMVRHARQTLGDLRATLDLLAPRAAAIAADVTRVRGHLAATDPIARAQQALATIRAAIDQLDPLVARLDELGQRLAAGEGSLGRLMTDPEFPEDAKDLGKILKRRPWRILERPADGGSTPPMP